MIKEKKYEELLSKCDSLFANVNNTITNLANASALLNLYMEDINWVGFYIYETNHLQLGPFQGKPACISIPLNKGVCGKAFSKGETLLVENVLEFEGHIACDSQSRSEIVVPINFFEKPFGVLDIDSPIFSRFTEIDKKYLELFVSKLEKYL